MNSSALSITLADHQNLAQADPSDGERLPSVEGRSAELAAPRLRRPFLRIPPFPGARICHFAELTRDDADFDRVARTLQRLRVGGCYWGARPAVPSGHVLVRSGEAVSQAEKLSSSSRLVLWEAGARDALDGVTIVTGECDSWHMLTGATALVTTVDDELRIVAALLDVPRFLLDPDGGKLVPDTESVQSLLRKALPQAGFEDPFTGKPMDAVEAIELCGFWRRMIDSNRDIGCGIGFATWKQGHVAPLLWNGSSPFRFLRNVPDLPSDAAVAVWGAKTPAAKLAELSARQVPLVEVEDGFLRSRGLGADCIPPLSLTIDRFGAYFDPSRQSGLERLLEEGHFDDELLGRANQIRRLIVQAGIGKYERGLSVIERPAGRRRHVLVPGQVEDDRAVIAGGCGLVKNSDLLARVRARAPDAFLLYKPHPDVLAGHRRGAIPDAECLRFADKIVTDMPIASLVDMVDEVHVNTSLAGFEALLREKPVTTHGVPFYAGWGLTTDLGPVPARRTAKRSLDELVAAALLLYPRYLDPQTGLPCPAEVVVGRLSVLEEWDPGLIVGLRRFQGKLMRRLRSLVQ